MKGILKILDSLKEGLVILLILGLAFKWWRGDSQDGLVSSAVHAFETGHIVVTTVWLSLLLFVFLWAVVKSWPMIKQAALRIWEEFRRLINR